MIMYKLLKECKKCKYYRGMDGSFVICNRLKDINTVSPAMPSFYNKGIPNGVMVVTCHKGE